MKARKLSYKSGKEFFQTAHTLRNSDMSKLFEFFNPQKNQVQIFGTEVNGDAVPALLEALGYDVTWESDGFWKVQIPEEYRTQKIMVQETIQW